MSTLAGNQVEISKHARDVFPGLAGVGAGRQFNRSSETITVRPYADISIDFRRDHTKEEDRFTTWVGRTPALPGASLVAVAADDGYDAILIIPGSSQLSYHIEADGRLIAHEADPGEEGCGFGPSTPSRKVASLLTISIRTVVYAAADISHSGSTTELAPLPRTAGALNVDVLFVYNADTLAAAASSSSNPASYISGQSKAMLESGNVVLAQSGVTNFVWNFVGCIATPTYTEGADLSSDLTAMLSGGLSTWITSQRTLYGADQIFLWRGTNVTGISEAGLAYSTPGQPIPASQALAAGIWGSSYKTVIHELAHGFGCEHDRAHAGANNAGVSPGDGFDCYGQLFTTTYFGATATAGTIMSYASSIIPYYSNPAISVNVTEALTGDNIPNAAPVDWGTQALGVASGQPTAAFNASLLQNNASAMSSNAVAIGAPTISSQPAGGVVAAGGTLNLSVTASGGTLAYQWYKDGSAISGATSSSYSLSGFAASNAGSYSVVVSNQVGASVTSNTAAVSLGGSGGLAVGLSVVTAAPAQQVSSGHSVTMAVSGPGGQWQLNGVNIPGANGSTYTPEQLSSGSNSTAAVGSVDSGHYTVLLGDGTALDLGTLTVSENAWLINISARAAVGTGANVLIGGFVTSGPDKKSILLRAGGPYLGLPPISLPGVLASSHLDFYSGTKVEDSANAWNSSLATIMNSVGAYPWTVGSVDSALLETVPAGAYTGIESGNNSATGVGLFEVYDGDKAVGISSGPPADKLINISARAFVGTGSNALIGGFVISGTTSQTVLIRGGGPFLGNAPFSLSGVVQTPEISLYDSNSKLIASNTGWSNQVTLGTSHLVTGTGSIGLRQASGADFSITGAYPYASGSADSAMVATLPPGGYTVIVTGTNNATGVGLVEIYAEE